jgi:hypothetical protein
MEVKAGKVAWFAQKSGCVIGTNKTMPRYIIISADTDTAYAGTGNKN